MSVERDNLIPDFFLKTESSRNGNEHNDNPDGDCGNTNFYNWRRNTTFIRFIADNAFSYKKFVIQFPNAFKDVQKYVFPDNNRDCCDSDFLWKLFEDRP